MNPDNSNFDQQTEIVTEITPLKALMIEMHELYTVLEEVGFTERQSSLIVAHQMSVALSNQLEHDDFEDDEDDEEWSEDEGTDD